MKCATLLLCMLLSITLVGIISFPVHQESNHEYERTHQLEDDTAQRLRRNPTLQQRVEQFCRRCFERDMWFEVGVHGLNCVNPWILRSDRHPLLEVCQEQNCERLEEGDAFRTSWISVPSPGCRKSGGFCFSFCFHVLIRKGYFI